MSMRLERFDTICIGDEPALDLERMTIDEVRQFNATRDWKVIAPYLKPNEFPTVYQVRECPQSLWSWVMAAGDDEEARFDRAFKCCVERVRNVYQRDGVRLEDWKPATTNGKPLPMDESEAAMFPNSHRAEIGRVAFEHSFLSRRTPDCFRLHALSVGLLARRTFRLAESSLDSAAGTSSGEPSGTSGTTPATSASGSSTPVVVGGSPTDATATGSP